MRYEYTEALKRNIKDTFNYAFAKNNYHCNVNPNHYDAIDFFEELLEEENPYFVFMELRGYSFKNTEKAITKYKIPVSTKQIEEAKFELEVIDRMNQRRADSIVEFFGDKKSSRIVELGDNRYTTKDTVVAKDFLDSLPDSAGTDNYIYPKEIPPLIQNEKKQMDAIEICLKNKVSCLIGGAGTGKSYVTAEIINQLLKNNKKVEVLAPTHKAKKSLQTKIKSSVTVKTIASFCYQNHSNSDVIIIDESGMLSTSMIAKLSKKYDNQQLIFVGDKNQLEPVEYGRPFEYIQENFIVAELTNNKRSEARDIVEVGKEILGQEFDEDCDIENIVQVSTIEEAVKEGAEVVLMYTNKDVGLANELLRKKDNYPSIYPKYSIGDEVIAKVNDAQRGFYNGDLFTITSYNTAKDKENGREIMFKNEDELAKQFDLAYGLTIHKSQGSEWDVVAYKPNMLDTRNLAYVAVTRAKKKLIVIGELNKEYREQKRWECL